MAGAATGGRRRVFGSAVVLALGLTTLGASVDARASASFTVTSTADAVDAVIGDGSCRTAAGTCTVRAAVQEANSTNAADTVVIPAGQYALTRDGAGENGAEVGDLDITRPLTVLGAGADTTVVDANGLDRVVELADTAGRVTLRGLTLRDGAHDEIGGALHNESTATVRLDGVKVLDSTATAFGGGIAHLGARLELVGTTVSGNSTVGEGGGVHVSSGALTVTGTSAAPAVVGDNSAREGGGIHHGGEESPVGVPSSVDLHGAKLTGNTAEGLGGGLSATGDVAVVLADTAVTDNAGDQGAGVAVTGRGSLAATRGSFARNAAGGDGGGLYIGSERSSRLTGVVFTANTAGDPVSGDGGGAGLSAEGTGGLALTDGLFEDNSAVSHGGGALLGATGTTTVTGTRFRGNHSDAGGGGLTSAGDRVTISGAELTGNTSDGDGGGLESEGSGDFVLVDTAVHGNRAANGGGFANHADGSATVSASTFWDNRALAASGADESGLGGGVFSQGDAAATYENTTITGNFAQVRGGGFYVDADAPVRVVSSTISGNSAPVASGVGGEVTVPPIPPEPSQGVTFRNTIVAGNLLSPDCNFAVGSEGGNLDSADTCYFRGPRDRSGVGVPRIDAVADNGGPTMTQALQDTSFAIDGGIAPCPPTDQRGTPRPRNGTCDIGALEHTGPFAPADTVPPDTALVNPPAAVGEHATFHFAGSDDTTPAAELLFECRVLANDPTDPPDPPDPTEPPDPEFAWLGCPNPYEVPDVEPGTNVIEVRSVDRKGNVDPTPATHTFTGGQDVTPPTVTFTLTPPNPSAGRTAVFGFAATDDLTPASLLEVECRLDSTDENAWVECASPHSVVDLTTGTHTFEVRAVDEGDNLSPVAAHTWSVASPTTCTAANVTLAASADAHVDEALPLENSGAAETLAVRSAAPGSDARALVRFAVPTDIPAACSLVSARLRLTGDGDAGRTLQAAPITGPWQENQVTWQTQPGTGGPVATTDSGAGQRQWDVTARVAAVLAGTADHGFLIRDAAEEGDPGGDQTYTSRHAEQDPQAPSTAPQLVLRFGGPGEATPTPPSNPTPAVVSCGQVVTQSIRLLNDLTDCPVDGLVVGAPNVLIDLNGHTVDGPGYFPGEPGSPVELPEIGGPAGVRNLGFANVTITNGTVRQFAHGIQFAAGSRFSRVTDLDVQRNAAAGVELVDADNGRDGNTVSGNRFDGNEIGLSIRDGSENSLIQGNSFTGSLGVAIRAQEASGHTIRDNTISGVMADPLLSGDGGVLMQASPDNTFSGNTIADTGDGGLVLEEGSHRNTIHGNTFSKVGDAGIVAEGADFLDIAGNTAHLSSDAGISIGDAHGGVVRDNDVRFNPGGLSLHDVSGMVVAANDARGTSGTGIELGGDSLGNTLRDNNVSGAGGTGISVDAEGLDAGGNPVGNLVERNTATGTSSDGIEITRGGHTLRDNAAHHNAGYGIQAAEDTVDGGGNTANGNGEAVQCAGVVCGPGTPGPPPGGDLVNPDTQLLTTPPNPSSTLATARFTFTGSDNTAPATALRFQCRLDAPPDPPAPEPEPGEPPQPPDVDNWAECTSPTWHASLPAGQHRFEVRAVDPADNVDLTPAEFTWTAVAAPPGPDPSPPRTTINTGPADPSSDTSATFGFRGTDNATPGPHLTYTCRLDGGAWSLCAPGVTHTGLALGAHTFEVAAVDLAGNTDPTPAAHTWTTIAPPVDTTPPDTLIAAGPDPTTVSTTAAFSFAASEPGTTFECSLDGGPWTACTSPHTRTGITVGSHTFAVRAVDAAGNADPSPAGFAWSVGAAPVPTAVNCGQVITQSVRVTQDLLDCPADGLVVGAHGITIDLDGTVVDGVGQGVGVRNDGFDSVTVTNGTVQQFDTGVALGAGTARGIVSGVTAQLNQEVGIALTDADNGTTGSTVRSNLVFGNAHGIRVADGTQGAVVLDNTVGGTAENAITVVGSSGTRVERNTVSTTGGMGVVLDAATNASLIGNTVSGTGKPAVHLANGSDGNRVEGNALGDGEIGVEVVGSDGNQVVANEVSGMNGPGVGLDDAHGNQVVGNELTANKDGLEAYASTGNRVEGNNASGNDSAGISLGDRSLDNVVVANVADQNSAEGISVEAVQEGSGLPGNQITRNTASGNSGDGIAVTKAGHRVTANTANGNSGWGVHAENGTTDGGGNRATGNTEPTQCHNVVCDGSAPQAPEVNPPDTTLLTRPPDPSGSTSASFTFTGADDNTPLFDLEFQCRLDSADEADFVDCENPRTHSGLAPGAHVFEVRAVDLAGKVDPTPALHRWSVVLPQVGVPPDTTITGGPAAQTPLAEAVFTFGSNEPDTTFLCSNDGGSFTACTSPVVLEGVLFGHHTFAVRAVDPEGNADPAPAVWTWTRVGPPVVTVTSGPDEVTTSRRAEFTFTANEPVARFECSLDLAPYVTCASPTEYSGLAIGEHSLRVRAVDLDGLTSGPDELAEVEWTVEPGIDTVPPDTAFTAVPGSPSDSATFGFTGTDDVTSAQGLTFECRLDSADEADFTACTTPWTYPNPDHPTPLTAGPHTLDVRAVDAEDNIDPTPVRHQWTHTGDVTAPVVVLRTMPPATTATASARFTFTADDPYATFECSMDSAAYEPCSSPHEENVEPGAHTLSIRAVDLSGNTSAPATVNWTLVPAPVVTFTSAPPATVASTTATFAFTSSQPGSAFSCSLDGAAFTPCTSPTELTGLAVGTHHFAVRASALGAVGETVHFEWTATPPPDVIAPQTTVVSGPPPTTTATSASVAFSASEPGVTFACSLDAAPFATCASPLQLTGLAVGAHRLQVRATDAAGNTDSSPAVVDWTVQSAAPPAPTCPTAPITLGAGRDSWVLSSATAANHGSDGVLKVESKQGDNARALVRFELPPLPTGCVVTAASLQLHAGSSAGGRTLQAQRIAGPWTEAGVTWSNQPAVVGTTAATASGPGYRTWAVTEQVNAMYAGANHGFLIRDAAESGSGSLQGLHSREKGSDNPPRLVLTLGTPTTPPPGGGPDTTPPDTTITSAPSSSGATAAAFTFTAEAGAVFQCSLDGAAFTACASPVQHTVALGAHTFSVRAVDTAGNVDPTPAVHTWAVSGACTAPGTVTVGADADAWVLQSSASSNYGQDSVLKVDSKSGNNARALVRFALPTPPPGCLVAEASLRLYASSYKSGRTLQAQQVTSAWTEGDVRWSNQPGVAAQSATATAGTGYRAFAVGPQVSAMYAGTNHGFLVRDAAENGGGHEQGFHSREKGSDNPPRLVITFG